MSCLEPQLREEVQVEVEDSGHFDVDPSHSDWFDLDRSASSSC